jgi:two-component system cell cycle sensor histidine kinase/response regulator CckA
VILNLAVNARDAMPQGGLLTIETAGVELNHDYAADHAGVEPGRYTMLAVSDTGIGMDAATRDRIFEPFFTTKAIGEGTGLGLATVHGIVEQSGGKIWVYSEPGRGTTFKLYFPAVRDVTPVPPDVRPPTPRGKSRLVLVAEDDESIRELARISLERLGYRVVAAANADEAIQIAASTPIAALLTDIVMPGRSGIELAAQIRNGNPGLPVVFMSGYAAGVIERQGGLGPDDVYIAKPFTPDDLGRAVAQAIRSTDRVRAGS